MHNTSLELRFTVKKANFTTFMWKAKAELGSCTGVLGLKRRLKRPLELFTHLQSNPPHLPVISLNRRVC